ncbi:GTPase [Rubrivivax gelatinosus]|nr:GTPase [Rubrivivax gelatinosus]
MNTEDTRAILTISLLAAFADGRKHEREHEQVRRIAEGLAQDAAVGLPQLVQNVLLKRVDVAGAAAALGSAEARQLAYEMAVGVCDADGAQSAAERSFLADLAQRLQLDGAEASAYSAQAETMAEAALPVATAPAAGTKPVVDEAELDRAIVNAAVVNGALELLPESLSTLAIIPLQMKLVHRVGLAYGYPLDSGHVKDFLATAGVGLTSQYLEQAGRKLLGGLLGKGLFGGLGKQAVSSGLAFATTWALGHVAKRYYAGGRTLSAELLRQSYTDLLQQARGLQAQYGPQIQQQARTLDTTKVMALVRGR